MDIADQAAAKLEEWDHANVLVSTPGQSPFSTVAAHAYLIRGEQDVLMWTVPYELHDPPGSTFGHQLDGRVVRVTDDAIVFEESLQGSQVMLYPVTAPEGALKAWKAKRTTQEIRADRSRELAAYTSGEW